MDEFVLIALLLAAIPICVIYLMFSHSGLKKKVRDLQIDVANLNAHLADMKDEAFLNRPAPIAQDQTKIAQSSATPDDAIAEPPVIAPPPVPTKPKNLLHEEEISEPEPVSADAPPKRLCPQQRQNG